MSETKPGEVLDHLFRHQAGRLTAYLARRFGPAHLDLAEEAVQIALLRALESWPDQGIPANPEAWLFRVASNAALDMVRRGHFHASEGEAILANLAGPHAAIETDEPLDDDELRLIFLCCHPEIPRDARLALSLKVACGFSAAEIARAFLAAESTIAQRIVRAKRLIREQRLSLDLPDADALALRLDSVLEVIYLLFNEGYSAHAGSDVVRHDLCGEALRLACLLGGSWCAAPRVHALTALIAFQSARSAARQDDAGNLIVFEDQDRSRWNHTLIALGFREFEQSMAGDDVSIFHVQAAIAATHAGAQSLAETDWRAVLQLYDQYAALDGSAVVALNRAIAVGKVHGPEEALRALEPLAAPLQHYHLYPAVRGYFLTELGRHAEAADAFRAALTLPLSEPERRLIVKRLAEIES